MISIPNTIGTIVIQPIQETSEFMQIIGIDTALYMYQKYRNDKKYTQADAVRKRIEDSEFWEHRLHVSFTGKEYRVFSVFNWNKGKYI